MFDLYVEQTPAVYKAAIMLEECGYAYSCTHIPVGEGHQHRPEFRAISPNGKIPVIVDHQPADGGAPFAVFESGAILLYLAEKVGRFVPVDPRRRSEALQWLFWQSSGLSPMSGQAIHFIRYAPEETRAYGQLRYLGEVKRHWGVLDKHLADREWIAGEFSVADVGSYPWVNMYDRYDYTFEGFPNLERWWRAMSERETVKRAYLSVANVRRVPDTSPSDFARNLFGEEAAKLISSPEMPAQSNRTK